jgi:hypothetical protein
MFAVAECGLRLGGLGPHDKAIQDLSTSDQRASYRRPLKAPIARHRPGSAPPFSPAEGSTEAALPSLTHTAQTRQTDASVARVLRVRGAAVGAVLGDTEGSIHLDHSDWWRGLPGSRVTVTWGAISPCSLAPLCWSWCTDRWLMVCLVMAAGPRGKGARRAVGAGQHASWPLSLGSGTG